MKMLELSDKNFKAAIIKLLKQEKNVIKEYVSESKSNSLSLQIILTPLIHLKKFQVRGRTTSISPKIFHQRKTE